MMRSVVTIAILLGGIAFLAIPLVFCYAILREGVMTVLGVPANPTQVRLAKERDDREALPIADYLSLTFVSETKGAKLISCADAKNSVKALAECEELVASV